MCSLKGDGLDDCSGLQAIKENMVKMKEEIYKNRRYDIAILCVGIFGIVMRVWGI